MKTKKRKLIAPKKEAKKEKRVSGSNKSGLTLVNKDGWEIARILPISPPEPDFRPRGCTMSIGVQETFTPTPRFTIFEQRGAVVVGTDAENPVAGEYMLLMENVPQIEGPPMIRVGYRYTLSVEHLPSKVRADALKIITRSMLTLNDIYVNLQSTAGVTGRHFLHFSILEYKKGSPLRDVVKRELKKYAIPLALPPGQGYGLENRIDAEIPIGKFRMLISKAKSIEIEEGLYFTMAEDTEFYCRWRLEPMTFDVVYPSIVIGPFPC